MKEFLRLISLSRQARTVVMTFTRTSKLLEHMNQAQKRTSTQNDEHGWKQKQHHRNSELDAELVCSFFQLGNTFSPKVDSDGAQSLAQRRTVLQALAEHGAEAPKSV